MVHAFRCNHAAALVVLSYTISVLGAYCALQWAAQIPRVKGWHRGGWVAGAAIAMGGGAIWSMHFIAMIACRLPVPVTYDVATTLASLIIAIVVTGIGLYTVGRGPSGAGRLLAGGAFTGVGVAAMHYTGMAAMRLPARTTYRPELVVASVLIAIVAATAALWIAFNMRGGLQRLLSSLVMGVAVCGMHYTGMAAASFIPEGAFAASGEAALKSNELGLIVFGITLFVLVLLSWGSRIIERSQTEGLRNAHQELQRQVAERTAELAKANEELRRDNAERREVEKALERQRAFLRQVIDVNPNLIFARDREGRFTLANQAVADSYGMTVENLVGKKDTDFNSNPAELESSLARDRELMDTLCENVIPEEMAVDSTGKVRWHQTVKRPIIGDDGTADQILSVATDITQRKALEEQLQQSQKMEAIGTLAGGVAHDFNNLLTTILGYSELLLGALEADSPVRSDVAEIKKAGDRAASLTRQLLAFSRKQLVEFKVLDLNVILADMDKMLRRLVGEDIEFVTLTDPKLGRVKADRGQIEQILVNLVVNSHDVMPRGGRLTIKSENCDLTERLARDHCQIEPGPYVVLSVSDTGIGMDPKTRARIFEPFFTTKEKGRGTGLGLSTVYGIVKQSGGDVWVDSAPGQGATLRVYLPRVDQDVIDLQSPDPSRALSGNEAILLVEDEESVRRLARTVLSGQGYTVLEACNGEEAVRVAANGGEIDLVLTDGVMPGMPVGDLVASLRSTRPRSAILLVSGHTGEEIIRRGIMESDMPFLQKPFTAAALLRKVREVLDAR
jgi:PAS domain S-box-containing protein